MGRWFLESTLGVRRCIWALTILAAIAAMAENYGWENGFLGVR